MIRNVRFLPPVPFAVLPDVMTDWAAAWIPFKRNELTEGVNPLKLREYLAAGLATHCTPLPEVAALSKHVNISDRPDEILRWMQDVLAYDDRKMRQTRRLSVQGDSWANRCAEMRKIIEDA